MCWHTRWPLARPKEVDPCTYMLNCYLLLARALLATPRARMVGPKGPHASRDQPQPVTKRGTAAPTARAENPSPNDLLHELKTLDQPAPRASKADGRGHLAWPSLAYTKMCSLSNTKCKYSLVQVCYAIAWVRLYWACSRLMVQAIADEQDPQYKACPASNTGKHLHNSSHSIQRFLDSQLSRVLLHAGVDTTNSCPCRSTRICSSSL